MSSPRQASWWSRHWKWALPVICLTPILVCGGLIVLVMALVFGAIRSSDVYQQSLAAVRASPEVQSALGEPIEPAFLVTGDIEVSGSSGHADLSYAIAGPDGEGVVHAVADRAAGVWSFETIVVEVKSTGARIDATPVR